MASAASSLAGADGVTLPELTLNVYTLDGFACSVVATTTLTVWHLKTLLKRRLQIPRRECGLLFGNKILWLPSAPLGDVFGVTEGTVDVTLVRALALCNHCGGPGQKRCAGCSTYYCGEICQQHDWPHHRLGQCSAARAAITNDD